MQTETTNRELLDAELWSVCWKVPIEDIYQKINRGYLLRDTHYFVSKDSKLLLDPVAMSDLMYEQKDIAKSVDAYTGNIEDFHACTFFVFNKESGWSGGHPTKDIVVRYVYVMSCQEFVKIGIAGNPISRLSGMQTANPHEVVLERAYFPKVDFIEAASLEALLHKELSDYKVRGEWFSQEALKVLDSARLGMER